MGQYVQLLFAGILEYVFLGTLPSTLSLIGAAIIMSSAIYVLVRFFVEYVWNISNLSSSALKRTQ